MDDKPPENEASATPANLWKSAGIVTLGVVALGAFAFLFATFTQRSATHVDSTLKLAEDQFNSGRWAITNSLTNSLTVSPDWTDSQRRLHSFLEAAGAVNLAIDEPELDARRIRISRVLERLNQADKVGFPEDYTREGMLLLARARYETGDFTGAAEAFDRGIGNRVDDQRRYLMQFADAQLRSPEYPANTAVRTIDQYLALPMIESTERAAGNLLRAQILSDQGRWEEAAQAVEQAAGEPTLRAECQLEVAKIHLNQARAFILAGRRSGESKPLPAHVRQLIDDALDTLYEIGRSADEGLALDATLAAGQAQRLLGEHEEALGLFGVVRLSRLDPAVAIAGSIEELEILAEHGTTEECWGAATYLARDIGDPTGFDPRLLSLQEFRRRLSAVIEKLQQREAFETSIDIARELIPIFDAADAHRMEAAGFALWGKAVSAGGVLPDGTIDRAKREEAKKLHASAGAAFAQAAELRFTTERYPSYLWDAIEQFAEAQRHERCLDLLEHYLKYEQRDQIPRGLILQAKAMMALKDFNAAIQICNACIAEFSRDSLAYEARLLAAQSARERGDAEAAQAFLETNLYDGSLAPDSVVWRNSLLALGDLFYSEAITNHFALTTPRPNQAPAAVEKQAALFSKNQELFESAIRTLDEAKTRYADRRESRRSIYLLAQAHRYAAHWPGIEANLADTLDSNQRDLMSISTNHMRAAAQTYRDLRSDLNSGRDDLTLTETEQAMLRNCYLGEADALFELDEFDEAIAAYSAAINRFINEPIALEALVQQARCFESLNRRADVQRLLKQAQQILDRIPAEFDDRFVETTRYDRAGWSQFLEWMLNS